MGTTLRKTSALTFYDSRIGNTKIIENYLNVFIDSFNHIFIHNISMILLSFLIIFKIKGNEKTNFNAPQVM